MDAFSCDTTVLTYSGEREGLGRIHDAGAARGFRLHASLAVTPTRTPLGVLGAETWARTKPPKRDLNRRHLRADPQRESLRWGRAVRACEQRLQGTVRAIHVMDREGDSYDLLSELEAAQSRYIIRLSHDRRLVGERDKLREVVGLLVRRCRFGGCSTGKRQLCTPGPASHSFGRRRRQRRTRSFGCRPRRRSRRSSRRRCSASTGCRTRLQRTQGVPLRNWCRDTRLDHS